MRSIVCMSISLVRWYLAIHYASWKIFAVAVALTMFG